MEPHLVESLLWGINWIGVRLRVGGLGVLVKLSKWCPCTTLRWWGEPIHDLTVCDESKQPFDPRKSLRLGRMLVSVRSYRRGFNRLFTSRSIAVGIGWEKFSVAAHGRGLEDFFLILHPVDIILARLNNKCCIMTPNLKCPPTSLNVCLLIRQTPWPWPCAVIKGSLG